MPLSPVRAAALAERLEIPLEGICLLCLTMVSSAIHGGDERDIRSWVRRMTPNLWHDGLDAIALRHVGAAAADDAEAAEAHGDLERDGPRSAVARAIVFDLARRLAAEEVAGRSVWKEAIERGDAVVPDWN